jgi:hypothetical protein
LDRRQNVRSGTWVPPTLVNAAAIVEERRWLYRALTMARRAGLTAVRYIARAMAQIRKPAITLKVYRHFAAITVAITLTLGFFANGEGRQALADEVAERQQQAELRQAQVARFGQPKLIRRRADPANDRGDGGGFDSGYGEPSDSGATTLVSGTWQGRVNATSRMPGSYAPYGISQAQWDAMSKEQREAFLRARVQPQPELDAAQKQRAAAGLLAASAARAGEAGEGDY